MKRSPIKRGKPLSRGSKRLERGSKSLKRGGSLKRGSRMRQVGKRGRAIREELRRVRAAVIERAGGICERCHDERCKPLHVHHTKRRSQGGEHTLDNLRALGERCHAEVHAGSADAHRWLASSKSTRERAS